VQVQNVATAGSFVQVIDIRDSGAGEAKKEIL
jgi:hypothetical protein